VILDIFGGDGAVDGLKWWMEVGVETDKRTLASFKLEESLVDDDDDDADAASFDFLLDPEFVEGVVVVEVVVVASPFFLDSDNSDVDDAVAAVACFHISFTFTN
jgi:hypothetical protein